jgi:hypothetical protein
MTPAQPALDAMMEGVTRYFLSDPYDAATMQPELPPFSLGEWVAATDYDALAVEVRAQRETIAGLEKRVEALRQMIALTDELCTAVDCEAEDIGGQRKSIAILRELGQRAEKAKVALSGEAPND